MKRRKFITTTALAAVGTSAIFAFGKSSFNFFDFENKLKKLAAISPETEADFKALLQWMRENGWTEYLQQQLGVNLNLEGEALKPELIKELDKNKLAALSNQSGFDDFAGHHLIKPGFPAFSLLYHALASPRVRSAAVKVYPSLSQIDTLENYIYALSDWESLKTAYNIKQGEELVFAVFAYEYRPAFKTPHHEHADLVFSRTGVARIGDEPMNYDKINRCYINKPLAQQKIKHIAVVPARYGLFLAKKAKNNDINLMRTGIFKNDIHNDSKDEKHLFLQPVRKIFNHDLLVGSKVLNFSEDHKSEKLHKLAISKNFKIWKNLKPQIKHSADLTNQTGDKIAGSSFLVISKHEPLIREARNGADKLCFWVRKEDGINRYFSAYSTQEVEDIELLNGISRLRNPYQAPRNQAMFLNITHQYDTVTHQYKSLKRDNTAAFENKIGSGGYYAPLFEDSICDGKVDVNISSFDLKNLKLINAKCLPAFSIVTAPDFFPQVDPFDLIDFDIAPGTGKQSNFYEGGVASLATARISPNPKAVGRENDLAKKTYTAVLSKKPNSGQPVITKKDFKNPTADRGYYISSFLPDVSSSVFAPGWDVTYSKDEKLSNEIYIGTEGLGSPFIEDMKFCAALNGMWPATSPDTSRTFQGSHETDYRNPTAIPLLDEELGYHKNSHCTDKNKLDTLGWDGEQGPYFEKVKNKWYVNFTDLGRADAVDNTMKGIIDMSKLRELTSAELISRMTCLRKCIEKLPKKNFSTMEKDKKMVGNTYLWLVSAEKVAWGVDDVNAHGIPENLIGNNKDWITKKENAKVQGNGYLYVFADSAPDKLIKTGWSDHKRRRLACHKIYVCQVTENDIAWKELLVGPKNWQV